MRLSDRDEARLAALTPSGCVRTPGWRYDWQAFVLRSPLRRALGGHGCGTIVADLALREDRLDLTDARLVR